MDKMAEFAYAVAPVALPAIAGWAIWISKTVSRHDAVIEKIDKLVDALLEDRLERGGE